MQCVGHLLTVVFSGTPRKANFWGSVDNVNVKQQHLTIFVCLRGWTFYCSKIRVKSQLKIYCWSKTQKIRENTIFYKCRRHFSRPRFLKSLLKLPTEPRQALRQSLYLHLKFSIISLFFPIIKFNYKGPFKRIKHAGQTLFNIVRWCWTVFDQCWIVLDACWSVQTNPTPSDDVGFQY